jgi:hypothetical protein
MRLPSSAAEAINHHTAKISRSAARRLGETRREEVRFLVLASVAHAKVVRRTGVSSGTVSMLLIKALGGGWNASELPTIDELKKQEKAGSTEN